MAHHSGSIEVTTSRWLPWFSVFGKVSLSGKKIRGFIYVRITEAWDAGHTLKSYDYATKRELFKLKLRGQA